MNTQFTWKENIINMAKSSVTTRENILAARSGLRVCGKKATEKTKSSLAKAMNQTTNPFALRIRARFMSSEEFIENHASGTLRKNSRLGFDYKKQLLHERTAHDFGYGFECVHESHVNWGTPITEGDCHPITEAGWHIDRYQFFAFPGDEFEAKYLQIHDPNGSREGVGIIIRKTSAPYIPNGYVVFALIAEVDTKKHDYMPASNPC